MMMSEEVIEAVARDFFEAALTQPAQDLDRLWQMQLARFREMSATYPEYVHARSLTTDAFRNARLAIRSVSAALQSHSQGNAGEVERLRAEYDYEAVYAEARRRMMRDATGGFYDEHLARTAFEHGCRAALAMQQAFVPPPVMVDERLLAVRKVRDGYADQLKFADIEAHGYFREFIRRIDAALNGGANVR